MGGEGLGWGMVRNKSEIDETTIWMKVMYGEIIRAGKPKQGITFGQNYWPW